MTIILISYLFIADMLTRRLSSSVNMKKQVSVITGWAFSQDAHLKKFAQLHEKLGNEAICFNMPAPLIFNNDQEKQRQYAQNALNKIKEKFGSEVDLVFHNLSNNGYNLFGHMESIIRQDPALTIKGAVLDSCPSPFTFFTSWLLPLTGWRSFYLKPNMFMPIAFYAYFIKTMLGYDVKKTISDTMTIYKEATINWKKFQDFDPDSLILQNGNFDIPGSYPLLFIYSKSDMIAPAPFITTWAEKLSQKRSVVVKCYEKSPHIAHYRKHPEEYERLVKDLLAKTK